MEEIEFREELERAISSAGISELFNRDRLARRVVEHFEKAGKLKELKEFVKQQEKRPDFQLKDLISIGKFEIPFYELLEEEGITFDPENFLRLNGERVAYVGREIIPLRGKKEKLKEVLEKIIELKKELGYPNEIYESSSEDLIEANKVAYDFGLFWKNLDKPAKESEDPFVQALLHINELKEYDSEEELKLIKLDKELRKSEIKLKLLEELGRIKINKKRKYRIWPSFEVEMNPGYEEFFYNHLGDYSREEIYKAFKEIENEAKGNERLKIRVWKKEFERREKINKKKKYGLLALIAASLAFGVGHYISQLDREPPSVREIEYKEKVNKDASQTLTIYVNEKNPSSSAILNLNNTLFEIPIVKDYGNGTIVYEKSFDPSTISTKEGKFIGNVTIKDKFNNKVVLPVMFYGNLRKPEIGDLKVEKIDVGRYSVSVEILDDSLIEAYLQFLNGSKLPLVKSNSRYVATLHTLEDLEFSIHAEDAYNMTSTLEGNIKVQLRDKFEAWLPSQFDKELSLSLFDSSKLFMEIFEKEKLDDVARILKIANYNSSSIPKNLAYQVLNQIENDYRIKNKMQTVSKTFELMEKLRVYNLKNKGSIFILGNFSSAVLNKLPEDLEVLSHLLKTDEIDSEVSYELFNFAPVYVDGINLWYDEPEIPLHIYTLGVDLKQNPCLLNYLKGQDANARFIQGTHRQRNFVLYRILSFNPSNETVRLIYVKPDIEYYISILPMKKIVLNGTEISFPLLPLLSRKNMREQFPKISDEMVIYSCLYHYKLTEFNIKTGENRWLGYKDAPWYVEYGRNTLLDNLEVVWKGWKWGKFEGLLIDRIIKAYTDKEWRSYVHIVDYSDHEWARELYYHCRDISGNYPDFKKAAQEFIFNYDPKLESNIIMDLGYRFSYGLAAWDAMKHPGPFRVVHQYIPFFYILNCKALGYAGFEILVKDPSNPYWHETVTGAVPKYLFDQLPSGIYFPGQMIHIWVYGYDTRGKRLEFAVLLPTKRDFIASLP